jgi:hypothetical protein
MTMRRWQLEPLKPSGETLDLCHYANVWRVFFLQKLEQTTKAKDPLRRRVIKLLREQKYLELQFWLPDIDMDNFVAYALTDFLSNDKALWLRATKPDTEFWERYHGIITEAYDNHGFTRKELIPLLQHPDPEMKMLGLKLMRSTLPDAEEASMRVRGR